MTPADEARALLEAATPGEWFVGYNPDGSDPVEYFRECYDRGEPGRIWLVCVPYQDKPPNEEALCTSITGNGPTSEANARLIAAAPRLLRELLEERERLREALRDLADPEMQYIGPMDAHVRVDMARRALKGEP